MAVIKEHLPSHLQKVEKAGIDEVFLVWPLLKADGADDLMNALRSHARRIVYLSAEAAGRRSDSFWREVELAIERANCEWTFLRPTGFASNTLMWADQIRRSDVVRWAYGRAARSLIDERDIAAVAVKALLGADHTGERHVLSGPEALTQTDQVRLIGAALGRNLRWEELPAEAIQDQLSGVPDSALNTWASFVATPEVVTSTVQEITGQQARPFAEWASDNAEAFR